MLFLCRQIVYKFKVPIQLYATRYSTITVSTDKETETAEPETVEVRTTSVNETAIECPTTQINVQKHSRRKLVGRFADMEDPYNVQCFDRGPGTIDRPTEIFSTFDARIVGCVCDEDSTSIHWMWLHKGQPKRCDCGYWFVLISKLSRS